MIAARLADQRNRRSERFAVQAAHCAFIVFSGVQREIERTITGNVGLIQD
jgi:hypothetical protein